MTQAQTIIASATYVVTECGVCGRSVKGDAHRIDSSPVCRKAPRKTSERVLAQRTLREVKRVFKAYLTDDSQPVLMKDWYGDGHYAIVWEGPYEWAYLASMGGVTVEPVKVEGAFLEPYASYALGVFRA